MEDGLQSKSRNRLDEMRMEGVRLLGRAAVLYPFGLISVIRHQISPNAALSLSCPFHVYRLTPEPLALEWVMKISQMKFSF